MGNREVFLMLDSIMMDTAIIKLTKTINVMTSSSIEGSVPYNTALSLRRMNTIRATFLKRYDFISKELWSFNYVPENWTHLRKAVTLDGNVPNRKDVLEIIDLEDKHPDTKEQMLKTLYEGVPWKYIHTNILPSSRGSVSMLFVPIRLNLFEIDEQVPNYTLERPLTQLKPLYTQPSYPRPTTTAPLTNQSERLFSIRTNLGLDIFSMLNIGIEFPLAPHWSISAEYIQPWWKDWDRNLTLQIQSLYFDIRYWISKRDSYNDLTGWSVSAYAGSGRYDIQPFSTRGVQGEYTDYGVTLSFAHKLGKGKHWLLEYTAGLGYVSTHYRNYYPVSDTEEYGDIKVHNYPWSEETLMAPLPTRLAITLVYLIRYKIKGRGGVK